MSLTVIPRAYIHIIFCSSSERSFWCFFTNCGSKELLRSLGISSSISPSELLTVFELYPFLLFPVCFPFGSCFSYPRCSFNSSSKIPSTRFFFSCAIRPSGRIRSFIVLQFFISDLIKAFIESFTSAIIFFHKLVKYPLSTSRVGWSRPPPAAEAFF